MKHNKTASRLLFTAAGVLIAAHLSCAHVKPIQFMDGAVGGPKVGEVYVCLLTPDRQEFKCVTYEEALAAFGTPAAKYQAPPSANHDVKL